MTPAELTLTAALGASFLTVWGSLGAVWLQQRRQDRAADQEWRRNEERPIVARMLTLSADALAEWQQSAQARSDWLDSLHADPSRAHEDTKGRDQAVEHWAAAMAIYEKLRFEAAQLDLIAGRRLRDVATKLVREHESLGHWIRPASGASDWSELATEQNKKIVQAHEELVKTTREDLGVDRARLRARQISQ